MNNCNCKALHSDSRLPISSSQASDTLSCQCSPQKPEPSVQDFPIGRFMSFLKYLRLRPLLKRITDPRDPQKTRYCIEFILQWALSVFFFRTGSLNDLQQSLDKLPDHRRKALWNFFGLPEGSSLPHRQTVTDALALMYPEEINALLIALFNRARKLKVFYNHQNVLGSEFGLACDGVVVHSYNHPHYVNEQGENICPYCLPRTRNKGTPDEKTYWIHILVNVAIILPEGLQLPLYVYALKAEQLKGKETSSEQEHKQECELQAVKEILPKIKKAFPRLSFVLQCDSLYANEPLLKLCKDLGIGFLIVRQEGSLKNLAKRCDALEKNEVYLSYQAGKTTPLKNGGKVVTSVKWFNGEYVGNQEVHVIRFLEVTYDAKGVQTSCYKTEWLSSKRVTRQNCFKLAATARRRADHEDLHNTLKNRGFNAKHDYARGNANAMLIWKLLMFVAFWIFELFSSTTLAQESKGSCSWKSFAKELLIDLLRESWEELSLSPSLRKTRIQFRWNFSQH